MRLRLKETVSGSHQPAKEYLSASGEKRPYRISQGTGASYSKE
jgi:hypothetical protein